MLYLNYMPELFISISSFPLEILIPLAIINLGAFLVMLIDKIKSADSDRRRISEGMMFFLATVGGSFGIYAGMFACRHKTQKWYFLLGIPLLMAQNLAAAYLIYQLLS
jgi:uncharacterized membrane protein YsdA (DUF1294 family)